MSVQALTWSFGVELPDMAAKAALNGLANYADEQGVCWPSIPTLARGAGCSDNTMRRAIQRLVDLALVERRTRPGQSDIYRLSLGCNPSHVGTPTKSVPLPTETPPLPMGEGTPPTVTGDPSHGGRRTIKNRQKNHQGTVNDQPRPLPTDWRPSQACRDFAADLGLDPDAVAEAFVDYWTSDKGRRTKRPDWDRTFRVWCRRDNARPVGQAANRPVQPARGGGAYLDQLAIIASRDDADERDRH